MAGGPLMPVIKLRPQGWCTGPSCGRASKGAWVRQSLGRSVYGRTDPGGAKAGLLRLQRGPEE